MRLPRFNDDNLTAEERQMLADANSVFAETPGMPDADEDWVPRKLYDQLVSVLRATDVKNCFLRKQREQDKAEIERLTARGNKWYWQSLGWSGAFMGLLMLNILGGLAYFFLGR